MTSPQEAALDVDAYRVLDAGCGGGDLVHSLPANAQIVGLDASPEALARNTTIHESIVGDLQTYPLASGSFDEVICWNVLEHIPDPVAAFANLAQALKPGGRMTIGVPNVLSAKALITKFTPIAFHVWVYRRFFSDQSHAGEPGHGPWKTYLRWSIRPSGLARLAAVNGLRIESRAVYEAEGFRAFLDANPLIALACRLIFPPGDPCLTECKMVVRKPGDG